MHVFPEEDVYMPLPAPSSIVSDQVMIIRADIASDEQLPRFNTRRLVFCFPNKFVSGAPVNLIL